MLGCLTGQCFMPALIAGWIASALGREHRAAADRVAPAIGQASRLPLAGR